MIVIPEPLTIFQGVGSRRVPGGNGHLHVTCFTISAWERPAWKVEAAMLSLSADSVVGTWGMLGKTRKERRLLQA